MVVTLEEDIVDDVVAPPAPSPPDPEVDPVGDAPSSLHPESHTATTPNVHDAKLRIRGF